MTAPLASEQALIEHLGDVRAARPLVISPGRGQAAWHLARQLPDAAVTLWYADLHQAAMARHAIETEGVPVRVACDADLPQETFDLTAISVLKRDQAEWTRDLLQQAHQRLEIGGHLMAAVDNPRDHWLGEQLRGMFEKVTCHEGQKARVYSTRKTKELRRVRDFTCEFAYRDSGRLIRVVSRPGVFSHRRIDPGARQLLETAEVATSERVLDLGCGCGTVGLACGLRAPGVQVVAVDSHARAIASTRQGAELNGIDNLRTIWNADGHFPVSEPFDLVLANPPYFGDFAVAEHFLSVALRVLRPGGAALFVTKFPSWYAERLPRVMQDVQMVPSGNYHVACGRQR